jgi:hypothetical protein
MQLSEFFELRTEKVVNVTASPMLLARADEVIE